MKTTKLAGAMLATAVALAFGASALYAGDAPSPSAQAAQIKCLGANACKGQSACKTKRTTARARIPARAKATSSRATPNPARTKAVTSG